MLADVIAPRTGPGLNGVCVSDCGGGADNNSGCKARLVHLQRYAASLSQCIAVIFLCINHWFKL